MKIEPRKESDRGGWLCMPLVASVPVEKEGWEKVDVVGKKRDYAPYEPQPKSQLVFISKIGIALIREIAAAWEECVGLPMKLNN